VTLSQKPHRQKPAAAGALQRKSNRTKNDARRALAVPMPLGDSPSAVDFDRSEWEIMYPVFVKEGHVNPSGHVNGEGV
jgi:hypothetical protein